MKQADTQIIRELNRIYDAVAGGGGSPPAFADITGDPSDNSNLATALLTKQTEAQVQTIADAKVESEAYGPTWNGDTTHAPAKNDVYDKIEAVVASIPGYKVYTALLTQTEIDAPVATVLQNTLGGTVTYGYISVGQYSLMLTDAFVANKTVIDCGSPINSQSDRISNLTVTRISVSTLQLETKRLASGVVAFENDQLQDIFLEIRVYP